MDFGSNSIDGISCFLSPTPKSLAPQVVHQDRTQRLAPTAVCTKFLNAQQDSSEYTSGTVGA